MIPNDVIDGNGEVMPNGVVMPSILYVKSTGCMKSIGGTRLPDEPLFFPDRAGGPGDRGGRRSPGLDLAPGIYSSKVSCQNVSP